MGRMNWISSVLLVLVEVATLLSGCAKHAGHGHAKKNSTAQQGHAHDDWWCAEHGIPESECALCDQKLAAECKKKGDWCAKHDRPDSQCFSCHPELKEQYAAKYRAKYGKEPPPTQE